jgi:uncharacterized protein (TIGR00369 family)
MENLMHRDDWFDYLKKDYVQGFPEFCGFEVTRVESGRFETRLQLRRKHLQQDGFVHAGVISTMADHTAGYAAFTTVDDTFRILTIEFKINFLRPAVGDTVLCRSKVLQGGKKIIVAESELFSASEGAEKRVSKAMVTLMAVPATSIGSSLGGRW